jgi:hypothetical protein
MMKNSVFGKYKDIHRGQRVFLIANGPSLARTNLDLLKDEITIAMNRVPLIYAKNPSWRPTYYLFSSTNVKHPDWGPAWIDSVREAAGDEKTTSFIARMFKDWIDPWGDFPAVHWFDSMSEVKPAPDGSILPSCFSTDIVERIDKSGTSMNLALQIAYHMGFQEIVIIGADLSWTGDRGSKNDPNHFDASYRADIPPEKVYKVNHQMRNVHSLARKCFLEKDDTIVMYNASLKTTLDVYPIIDYEKYAVKNEVVYLEDKLSKAKASWDKEPQFG